MSYSAALFDLDGTLLDTLEDIADAVNRALASLSLPVHPVDAYRTFVGEGISVLARRVLPLGRQGDDDAAACLKAISREYGGGLLVKTKPFEGITDLLAALAKKNIRCGVVSNKPHELAIRSVATLFAEHTFEAVIGQRPDVPTKPDPAGALEAAAILGAKPSDCLYIGDSGIDMQTAQAAGMFGVGVLWGFRTKEELLHYGARAVISHPSELLELL